MVPAKLVPVFKPSKELRAQVTGEAAVAAPTPEPVTS
jgi:hypothetical protein